LEANNLIENIIIKNVWFFDGNMVLDYFSHNNFDDIPQQPKIF